MCSRSLWYSAAAKNWLTLRLSPPPYGRNLSAKKNLRETEITEEVCYAVTLAWGWFSEEMRRLKQVRWRAFLICDETGSTVTYTNAATPYLWVYQVFLSNMYIYIHMITYIYTDMMIWIFVMIHYATTATILLYYTVAHRLIISGDLRYAERILGGTFSFWVQALRIFVWKRCQ